MANWFTRRIEKAADTAEQLIWGAIFVSVIGAVWVFYEGLRGAPMYIAIGFFTALLLTVGVALILKSVWPRHGLSSAAQKTAVDALNRTHQHEIRGRDTTIDRYIEDVKTLKKQNENLNLYVTQHSWLHNIASTQARDINHYVRLERITLGDIFLNNEVPYIKFGLYVLNKSLFDVTVELEKKCCIVFRNQELHYEVKIVSDGLMSMQYDSERCLTIEQRLTPEEAHYISSSESVEDATFYFDKLVMTIKGGRYQTEDIRVQQKPLWIDKGITLHGKVLTFPR
jgi:hypothetical protein